MTVFEPFMAYLKSLLYIFPASGDLILSSSLSGIEMHCCYFCCCYHYFFYSRCIYYVIENKLNEIYCFTISTYSSHLPWIKIKGLELLSSTSNHIKASDAPIPSCFCSCARVTLIYDFFAVVYVSIFKHAQFKHTSACTLTNSITQTYTVIKKTHTRTHHECICD